MEFKRLSALYDAGAMIDYKGKRYEIVGLNELKKTAQLANPDGLFEPAIEVKAEDI
ncbi:hypothetical protein [Limosilactobacillus caviae]|uniref:hypothetical protein n=1 Tax=Limosilactobacillus caviae TaxID=1769424 RepID=UPI00129A5248|nr:hypothetical protein [Limosilactobacillus caviae]MCD7123676.1 hypothetical protein [Limosilactobacillus caviae]MRH46538.1 hypothetical protein [Limosilactobacillus reuteri]